MSKLENCTHEIETQMAKEIKTCNECNGEFYSKSSQMAGLCPECSHYLYGYENCVHIFKKERCIHCYWDGKNSEFINKKRRKNNENAD
ncbi:hypothetical protein [Aureispira sp. CCB-E]|uniref:hypothetical protein n=1 Tax=Aureispira sp. CCB-E TaxID=3051121 RepID=UPI0028693FFC|nr:hypothetical protein [Aureispira sp. CCB-E]WMX13175.1 hypothetical protein QP953_20235 [Aureispira sp. CCB-E]